MKIFKKSWLNKPFIWAVLYLFIILIFTCIYTFVDGLHFEYKYINDSNIWSTIVTNLYLSIVTITTLGYGDITPLNTKTQFFCAMESFLGIIFIGVFLNALSQKHSAHVSSEEKKKELDKKYKYEVEKLLRYNKLIRINMELYSFYIIRITNPFNENLPTQLNQNFSFNDMHSLYGPSGLLKDSFYKPAINYFYKYQKELESLIKELVFNVEVNYWPDLEKYCLQFIKDCKELDYSEYILDVPNINELKDRVPNMIKEHTGEIKYIRSNAINPYIALYNLIKNNIEFIENYHKIIDEIKNDTK